MNQKQRLDRIRKLWRYDYESESNLFDGGDFLNDEEEIFDLLEGTKSKEAKITEIEQSFFTSYGNRLIDKYNLTHAKEPLEHIKRKKSWELSEQMYPKNEYD